MKLHTLILSILVLCCGLSAATASPASPVITRAPLSDPPPPTSDEIAACVISADPDTYSGSFAIGECTYTIDGLVSSSYCPSGDAVGEAGKQYTDDMNTIERDINAAHRYFLAVSLNGTQAEANAALAAWQALIDGRTAAERGAAAAYKDSVEQYLCFQMSASLTGGDPEECPPTVIADFGCC